MCRLESAQPFPQEVLARFHLISMLVLDASGTVLNVADGGPSREIRGKTDALLVYGGINNIMAAIELKKQKPRPRDLSQLLVQMYALQRKSKFSVFGVLTDLRTTWYIVWYDSTTVGGRDVPCYFWHFSASMALPCIRALICGNMKRIKKYMPKFISTNTGDANDDDSDDGDEEQRNDRKAWQKMVRQRSAADFNRDRPKDVMTGAYGEDAFNDANEPIDHDLYQKLADEGIWDNEMGLSETLDDNNEELQLKLLASAAAEFDGLSKNEIMARLYEEIQENYRRDAERAEEASSLAAERVQALQNINVR